MSRPDPNHVQRVALIGAGTIGSGWAAHFLRLGLEVVAYDPAPGAETRLRRKIEEVWPTLEQIGLEAGATRDNLVFETTIADAVSEVQFIQENTPERPAAKTRVIEAIDVAAAPEIVIASSTSGVPMTAMQAGCRHPGRCIVGHPFVPPYLIPLVEVVGGEQTDPEVIDWAMGFYQAYAKRPLRLNREYPGFLANRLLEAVWRESLHLIAEGLATVEEIDVAMSYAPALRWAIMGPIFTYHLGGGEGGMAHFLDQFGPALDLPWSYMDAPELTPALRERLVEGCEAQAAGRAIAQLEGERDRCLMAILAALEGCREGKAQAGP